MLAHRKRKLFMLIFIVFVVSLASTLVLYALRQNISLFYTPTQVVSGEAPINHNIRIGGMVQKNSIVRSQKGMSVKFMVTDYRQHIEVNYTGILPDLFREEQGIVVDGLLVDKDHFQAFQVLAKHDANYMPPEVKSSLAKKAKV